MTLQPCEQPTPEPKLASYTTQQLLDRMFDLEAEVRRLTAENVTLGMRLHRARDALNGR